MRKRKKIEKNPFGQSHRERFGAMSSGLSSPKVIGVDKAFKVSLILVIVMFILAVSVNYFYEKDTREKAIQSMSEYNKSSFDVKNKVMINSVAQSFKSVANNYPNGSKEKDSANNVVNAIRVISDTEYSKVSPEMSGEEAAASVYYYFFLCDNMTNVPNNMDISVSKGKCSKMSNDAWDMLTKISVYNRYHSSTLGTLNPFKGKILPEITE